MSRWLTSLGVRSAGWLDHSLRFFIFGLQAGRPRPGGPPGQIRYLDTDSLEVMYKGQLYTLESTGSRIPAPFSYRFKQDGDDFYLDGRNTEIDSPYDAPAEVASSFLKKSTKKNPSAFFQNQPTGSRRQR